MCDLFESMEEGAPLQPKTIHIHDLSSRLSSSSISPSKCSVQLRTDKASKRSNAQFYTEALDFLINVGDQQILQIPDKPSAKSTPNSAERKRNNYQIDQNTQRKSYQHCLQPDANPETRIDLSRFPACVRECPLKEELNKEFWEEHPFLSPKLTLSKIVSLKDALVRVIVLELNYEPLIAAAAWTYFERLLRKGGVTKGNRKVSCAVCVLLAVKFYTEISPWKSKECITRLDPTGRLSTKAILAHELSVYADLHFSLKLDFPDIQDTLASIQKHLDLLVSL